MKLKEYLQKRGLKILYVSGLLGIHRNTLTSIDHGIPVSKQIAEKVISWSNGEVDVIVIQGDKGHVRNRPKNLPHPT